MRDRPLGWELVAVELHSLSDMRKMTLLVLLAVTLSTAACTSEPYHRAFHHPFNSHEDWQRHHNDRDR
jgi:hypothetical protein